MKLKVRWQLVVKCAVPFWLIAGSAIAQSQFGYSGRNGDSGRDGRNGRDGLAIEVIGGRGAQSFDVSGYDGEDAGQGENGFSATNCQQPQRPSHNVVGAEGGDGGRGGNGGSGGNTGEIRAYVNDISELKQVLVRGVPGRGGRSAWGGRGGEGCNCQESSWEIPASGEGGSPSRYYCQNGSRGRDAGSGSQGSNGGYGQVVIVPGGVRIEAEKPSIYIDMAKMGEQVWHVTKNHWEQKRGATSLFASGSQMADSYFLFKSRTDKAVKFVWNAPRPVTAFANWQMLLRLEGEEAKFYLPDGVWFEGVWSEEGDVRVYTFNKVVTTNELAYIQFESFNGIGEAHEIVIKDSQGMAHMLNHKLHVQFQTVESGQWKKHLDVEIPAESFTVEPTRIVINLAKAGVDPALLSLGKKSWIQVMVGRSLGQNSVRYQLNSNYTIRYQIVVGSDVDVTKDANTYYGNTVAGSIKKGERYKVSEKQGEWVRLKKPTGELIAGWASTDALAPASNDLE